MAAELTGKTLRALVVRLSGRNPPAISELAERYGVDYQELYRMLVQAGYEKRRTHRKLSSSTNSRIAKAVTNSNLSLRKIARNVGCAYSTVQVRASNLRDAAAREAETELSISRGQHVCERHGSVKFWPCVACAAERERARRKSASRFAGVG